MTPEGRVRQYLKTCVKAVGWEHRKLGWIGRRKAPDEFIFAPLNAVPVCAFVECKAFGKEPDDGQQREITRLRGAGFQVFVVDSEASIDAMIETLVNP